MLRRSLRRLLPVRPESSSASPLVRLGFRCLPVTVLGCFLSLFSSSSKPFTTCLFNDSELLYFGMFYTFPICLLFSQTTSRVLCLLYSSCCRTSSQQHTNHQSAEYPFISLDIWNNYALITILYTSLPPCVTGWVVAYVLLYRSFIIMEAHLMKWFTSLIMAVIHVHPQPHTHVFAASYTHTSPCLPQPVRAINQFKLTAIAKAPFLFNHAS